MILTDFSDNDIDEMVEAFKAIGWHKTKSLFEAYRLEQSQKLRSLFIAKIDAAFAGYVTLKWKSDYPFFQENTIPEIADLNVLPMHQKQGIGSALILACENVVATRRMKTIGLGVGMTADYGAAQRLYVKLGYIPDGRGMHYQNRAVQYGDHVRVDDDLQMMFFKVLK